MKKPLLQTVLACAVWTAMCSDALANESAVIRDGVTQLETIVVTAEEQVKQSLGASVISKEDLENTPVRNDISEIVRRMPGVNLTGNSATGQRGNNRQIDIRGMGPENTLILIDGKPVNSRNSVRYGWRGERDTRGDSNWVPADAIESIEVLRGPAAARYGSGAAGGVVNIITKKVTNDVHGSLEYYTNIAEHRKEGDSYRTSATLSGPIIPDVLSYRLYGNFNKTKPDAIDINTSIGSSAAGREGVENKDGAARFAWQVNGQQTLLLDLSSGRQGNIFAGDSQLNNNAQTNATLSSLYGSETNTMYRDSYALTHLGDWQRGSSKLIAQYDKTKNKRFLEGLGGSTEGAINTTENKETSKLETLRLAAEMSIPFQAYVQQNLTLGAEWTEDEFKDTANTTAGASNGLDQITSGDRSAMSSRIVSVFAEDNLKITDTTDLVLGLRFDDHDKSGSNWSPSLNITQGLGERWTLKGGIAKAYKAPNMYQNAEGYLITTNGNGCPQTFASKCILQGNGDLSPETSVNKELGVQYEKDAVKASLTWFRNDYKDKISAGTELVGTASANNGDQWNVLRWENIPEALIQGLEGSIALSWDNISWTNNFTYMRDSKDKTTGNPLSLVPNYTVNSIFDYDVNDRLDVNFIYTQYGRQQSRTAAESRIEAGIGSGGAASALQPSTVKSYGVAGINAGYKFSGNLSARAGISNLFDEQKLRDSNSTSQTYNEPGRAYYASLKYQF